MQTGNDENIDDYITMYLHTLIIREEDSSIVNSSQKSAVCQTSVVASSALNKKDLD